MLQLKPKRAESIPTVHAARKRCNTGLTAGIPAPKLILGCIVVQLRAGQGGDGGTWNSPHTGSSSRHGYIESGEKKAQAG